MKTKIFLTISFLTILGISINNAQIMVGLKIGLNLAKSSDDDIDHQKSLGGLCIGAVAEYKVNDLISAKAELLYARKGWKSVNGDDFVKVKKNYLDIPITLNVGYDISGFNVYGGPGIYFGYWLGGKYQSESTYTDFWGNEHTTSEDATIDFDKKTWEDCKRLDIGLNINAGASKEIGNGKMFAELRYGFGFVDTDDNGDQNRAFSLSFGYLIKL